MENTLPIESGELFQFLGPSYDYTFIYDPQGGWYRTFYGPYIPYFLPSYEVQHWFSLLVAACQLEWKFKFSRGFQGVFRTRI